jgi:phosphopantetheine--protein transferase-like protein
MNSFISNEQSTNWFETNVATHHCQFNRELYKDELFSHLGIQFPASLIKAVTKRRAEFLAGRYCAETALQQLNIHNSVIGTGKHRNPLWPLNIKGSISHCDDYAIAVVTNRNDVLGIGVDIESKITEETFHKTRSQILSEAEIDLISFGKGKQTLAFAIIFSLKESFFKAAYPTIEKYFDFNAISVDEIDWDQQTIAFVLNETLHEKFKRGMLLRGDFHLLPEEKVATSVIVEHMPR